MNDKVFVDTNVLIYAHDVDAGEDQGVRSFFLHSREHILLWSASGVCVTCTSHGKRRLSVRLAHATVFTLRGRAMQQAIQAVHHRVVLPSWGI